MKLESSLPVATSSATSSMRVSWPGVCACVCLCVCVCPASSLTAIAASLHGCQTLSFHGAVLNRIVQLAKDRVSKLSSPDGLYSSKQDSAAPERWCWCWRLPPEPGCQVSTEAAQSSSKGRQWRRAITPKRGAKCGPRSARESVWTLAERRS